LGKAGIPGEYTGELASIHLAEKLFEFSTMAHMCIIAHMSKIVHCSLRPNVTGRFGFLLVCGAALALPPLAPAQTGAGQAGDPIRLPPVTVNVYKEPEDVQRLPVSVTGVSENVLKGAGAVKVSDVGILAPNTFYSEFTARKLSNARFRGIGSSPANPGITTYIDGVPQLYTNSSNIEFLDIEQVEFVRGPQSALFGRNTLGGMVNVTTRRPSLASWTGSVTVPLANYSEWDARASASGPLSSRLGASLTVGRGKREGFTRNDVTGNDLDYRAASYGKAQLWWTPVGAWEARLIVTGERARDGDYALHDLQALRQNPFHVSRDFEGFTNRNVLSTTIQTRYEGSRLAFSTTTGLVRWKTQDVTDLDYSARPLITRDNTEKDFQFTQELRFASPSGAPARLGDNVALKWQAGLFLFTQNYDQDAINNFSPFLLSPQLGFPIRQHSPQSELDDAGVGLYGQATATVRENFDLTFGGRVDHENREAALNTFYEPAFIPGNAVSAEKSFSNVSPQFAASYRFRPGRMFYVSAGRGFKGGGFNSASPAGSEAYGEERAWHLESGVKTVVAGGKLSANAAFFYIDWNGLQLNVPNPDIPAQFYIRNIGSARSKGFEFDLNARPHNNVDLFATFGLTHARFGDGTASSGATVSGNRLPSTPDHTVTVGGQLSRDLSPSLTLYGRGEVWFNGGFEYDDANTQRQAAYSLAHFRAGLRGRYAFVETWLKNAFDTRYIPIAFAYGSLAPSGFVGEMGAPRRFGVTLGMTF
jgi:iron complex outermembrane receptor protein